MALINCPNCDKDNVADSGKCPNCNCDVAFELEKIKDESIFKCPECKTKIKVTFREENIYCDEYCKECGFPIQNKYRQTYTWISAGKCPFCGYHRYTKGRVFNSAQQEFFDYNRCDKCGEKWTNY